MDATPHNANEGLSEQELSQLREALEDPTADLQDPRDFWRSQEKPQQENEQEKKPSWARRAWESLKRSIPNRSSPVWDKLGDAAERAGKRLIARERAFGRHPWVAGGIAAAETYRFGREAFHYLKEERELMDALKHGDRSKPFHWSAEQDRLRQLEKAEWERGTAWRHGVREASKGRGDHNPSESSSVLNFRSKVKELRTPSVLEAMSKAGDSQPWRLVERQRLQEATQGAKDFMGKGLEGSAGEKYQYLLTLATDELGAKGLDRVYNPERVLRFERFAAERMYVDGYNLPEIRGTLMEKSPYITGTDQARYLDAVTERFKDAYPHPELSQARMNLARWRQEEHLPDTSKHTPREWQQSRQIVARNAEALSWGRLKEAEQVLDQYRRTPEMQLTTTQEYQVELARIHEKSPHLQNYDTRTSMKLIIAGHSPKEIATALDEASPFSHKAGYTEFEAGKYGERTVEDAEAYLGQDSVAQQYARTIRIFKRENDLEERRLDKLGLAHNQRFDQPNSATRSMNQQPQQAQSVRLDVEH